MAAGLEVLCPCDECNAIHRVIYDHREMIGCTDVLAGDDDITKIGHVDGDINAACHIMPGQFSHLFKGCCRAQPPCWCHATILAPPSLSRGNRPLHAGFGGASVLWC